MSLKGLLTSSTKNKALVNNMKSLFSLQVANYLFPLVTFPYLVRVLGPDRYGLIMFANAFVQYFVQVTEFGFNFTGVRAVSENRENTKLVSELYTCITAVKVVIALLGLLVFSLVVFLVPKFNADIWVYLLTFGLVFENVLFPMWLFQGMQEMGMISVRTVAAKALYSLAIFIFVHERADYLRVPLINSISGIFCGLIGLRYAVRHFGLELKPSSLAQVRQVAVEAWPIFISMISIRLYATTNTFVLGLVAGNVAVGFYSTAEKIIQMVIGLYTPVFQAIYPHVTVIAAESRARVMEFLKKLIKPVAATSLFISLFFLTMADPIITLILGDAFHESIHLFRLLTPLIVLVPLGAVAANLTAIPLRLDKHFTRIYVSGALFNLLMLAIIFGVFNMGAAGSAVATIMVEAFVTMSFFIMLKKHFIYLW